ncbi:NUDIX domain-containing protein [Henriciella aquimarina]|uniref:NUDIX domain-containing protein n=1 Tax=Henriciella aquimarina TaxID=545261 RepID=UPI000A05B36E|nr:NUDIX domain-containing protein [Henriciella aquimarina]
MSSIRTRLFQTWFRLSRPMTLGVRGVVENAEGQVLLVRHTYTKGLFFPGGGVERGETALYALERELAEEAGVQPSGPPRLIGIYSNHRVFRNDHVVLYRVVADGWTACATDSAGEIAERIWADPLSPPHDVTPGTGRRLAELYADGGNDGHW